MFDCARKSVALAGLSAIAFAPVGHAASFSPISGFNPNTYITDNPVDAGIDFNDGSPTQAGFTGIPASNNKSYNVTNNGITFDIAVTGANAANQNRDRGSSGGDLVRDFEQWFNSTGTGVLVEAAFTLTGLQANQLYEVSFFTYNIGSGQTTHRFYEGTSSAAPLITTFATSGNQNNFATWTPGVTFLIDSGSDSEISVTAQSSIGSRLTINGVTVTAVPSPTAAGFAAIGMLGLVTRRRRK